MISFTWASLTVDFVVILILILRSGVAFKRKENRQFIIFPFILIIVGISYGMTSNPIPAYIPQSAGYLFFVRLIGTIVKLFLAYYVVTYMASFVHDSHMRLIHALLDPAMAAAVIEILINPFRHIIFYYDSGLSFHPGPLDFTFYIIAVYFYCIGGAVLIINRKKMSKETAAAILTLVALSMTGMLVQTEFPVKNFDLFIHSICCILMLYTLLDSGDLVLALTKKNEEINQLTQQTIYALTGAIEAKDPYTSGHSGRVADYCEMIAAHLGMDETERKNIYYAALMHDVGKVGIPERIIEKPTHLTTEEYETIKQHTIIGASITKPITALPMIEQGAHWHHEHFDGSGYPDGIKGENIPLVSRIIGVADAYDAMTTDRPYRKAQTEDYAEEEIRTGLGTQFDPEIGKIMLEILENKEAAG